MVADARALLAAAGYAQGQPWVELGIGLDFGTAFVGNVGSGEVKDFTAIGDVVNTAARLQAAAAGGEIVMSQRVHDRAGERRRGRRAAGTVAEGQESSPRPWSCVVPPRTVANRARARGDRSELDTVPG